MSSQEVIALFDKDLISKLILVQLYVFPNVKICHAWKIFRFVRETKSNLIGKQ